MKTPISSSDCDRIAGYAEAILQAAKVPESALSPLLREEQETGHQNPSLVIPGLTISVVVLTALAAELILKAWIARTKGTYPHDHNLLTLFKQIKPELSALYRKRELDSIEEAFTTHKNDFTHWRYLFEHVNPADTTVQPDPDLRAAITLLVAKYHHPSSP